MTMGPDLDLPEGIQDIYSEAYGRYRYAILNAQGKCCSPRWPTNPPSFPMAC